MLIIVLVFSIVESITWSHINDGIVDDGASAGILT